MSFNAVRVRVGGKNSTKVVASNGCTASVTSINSLTDVDASGKAILTLLRYNSNTTKWEAVDPDQILIDAAADGSIPASFINILDTDLSRTDNIDLDGNPTDGKTKYKARTH